MHVFKSKFLNYASAAFFTLLMFIAFCADSYRLVPMMAKYAVNLLVLGWGHWESGFLNFRRLIISCADR